MDDEEFKKVVADAVESIPEDLKEKIENVSIEISEYPSAYQLKSAGLYAGGATLLGLYEGVPQTKRGNYGIGATVPDKITIFKIPILMISRNYHEAKINIRNTVIHEIAHHFGMSESEIRKKLP